MSMPMVNHSINYTARLDENALEHIRCALIMMLAGDNPETIGRYNVIPIVGTGIGFGRTPDQQLPPVETLVLYQDKVPVGTRLAYPHTLDDLSRLVHGWLTHASYGPEPDIDGHCVKGYRLFTDEFGDVEGDAFALIATQPMWAIVHK